MIYICASHAGFCCATAVGWVTWRGAQRAVVEETVGGVVAAAAHSGPGVSVVVRLTLLVKVGSRGL